MLKVMIRETGAIEQLELLDNKSGCDYSKEIIGNNGGFIDGQFEYDDENDVYRCSQETYDWWVGSSVS